MPRTRFYLFGTPRLERDLQPVEIDTRKAIALLAYLVVSGETHTREALAALLWPEYDEKRARAALRRTLSTLNTAFAGEYLEISRETVGLAAKDALWSDVVEFGRIPEECRPHRLPPARHCVDCISALETVVELYRGDFMAGFSLRDSLNFDDWQFFQAETLRRDLSGHLECLAKGHTSLGDFERAIEFARRWLALDQLHEPAHRQLMQLYYWTDQRSAALRQYRQCVRILDRELGVAPLEETTQVYQSIQENRLPQPAPLSAPQFAPVISGTVPASAAPVAGSLAAPALAGTLPLAGREQELSRLHEAYSRVGDSGFWCLLEGEAGIGKTRLAEEFLRSAPIQNAPLIYCRCYLEEGNLAFGPLIEGLRRALSQPGNERIVDQLEPHWRVELGRLLPEVAPEAATPAPYAALPPPQAQSNFHAAIAQVLLSLGQGDRAPVLIIDNLHWADSATLDLFGYLIRRLRSLPLFVLSTWRTEEVLRGHPLLTLAAVAHTQGLVEQIKLARLSFSDVKHITSHAGGAAEGDAAWVERLYRETEGLPFFLAEYLADYGSRTGVSAEAWETPATIQSVLQTRIAGLSETAHQLLSAAAVIGRSFDFDLLRAVSGRAEEEAVTGLEELVGRGMVRELTTNEDPETLIYDFTHEKLRTAVYAGTSLPRKRLLHRRVAEALLASAQRRGRLPRMAGAIGQHFAAAAEKTQAAQYHHLAGSYARSVYANSEALGHFQAALALDDPQVAQLHAEIGDIYMLSGHYSDARKHYETAASLAIPQEAPRMEHKLGQIYDRIGEWELAETQFELALEMVEGPPGDGQMNALRAAILNDWSMTAHRRGDALRAADLAARALQEAQKMEQTHLLAQSHNLLGILARHAGDPAQARQHLEQSLLLADSLPSLSAAIAVRNNLALLLKGQGDCEAARKLLGEALDLCRKLGDRHREAALLNNLADLAHQAGEEEIAMRYLKQAVVIFTEIGEESDEVLPEIWKLSEW